MQSQRIESSTLSAQLAVADEVAQIVQGNERPRAPK
jgi:hypothetical protein